MQKTVRTVHRKTNRCKLLIDFKIHQKMQNSQININKNKLFGGGMMTCYALGSKGSLVCQGDQMEDVPPPHETGDKGVKVPL